MLMARHDGECFWGATSCGPDIAMFSAKIPPQQLSLGEAFDAKPNRRLFLGMWPDESARAKLTNLMQRLRDDRIVPGRSVAPDRLHVTLLHLDDFTDQIPLSLLPAVQAAVASLQLKPFNVTFDRVCCTPKHVLLFPSDSLASLQAFREQLRSALFSMGLSMMISNKARQAIARPFSPHVTLSYNPGDAPETRVEPIGWIVREFHLVESLLGKHQHIRLITWPLAASA